MPSIKGNIILNALNSVTSIIFPVITFPYAARILLPNGIGTINFLISIINYIVLITSLGIPMYAIKEVAKYSNDLTQRNKITVEILSLSFILCLLGYIIVFILGTYVPQIHQQSALFYILSLTIIFTSIGANWFYQGIEDFKFITIRGIIIRTLSAVALFVFVKNSSDLLIYGLIIVGSTVGNNIINFFHLRKFISISKITLRDLDIIKHINPILKIFTLNVIISLYVHLNTVILGFLSNDEAVGIYTGGIKITYVAQTIILSIGSVMIPRCSHLIKAAEINTFKLVINKSLNLSLCLAFPLLIGALVLAKPIILFFCGPNFYGSISVFRFDAPLILLSSLSNLIANQVLFTQDKINLIIKGVSTGAILDIILNFILIPQLGANGAAISAVISEIGVLTMLFLWGRHYIPFNLKDILNIRYIISASLVGIIIVIVISYVDGYITQLIVGIPLGIITYALLLYRFKEPLIKELFFWIRGKLITKYRND